MVEIQEQNRYFQTLNIRKINILIKAFISNLVGTTRLMSLGANKRKEWEQRLVRSVSTQVQPNVLVNYKVDIIIIVTEMLLARVMI
jgi:hypothetical protein